ncbi:MAG TPA: sulfotransferase [Sphingomonas sp.]|nr:sulfotransferase [Sphingomonas sp.]
MQEVATNERQVFFVCGAPKSGTTWLQRLLDAHPEILCSGEGHFIEHFSIPLAKVMRDYAGKMRLVADRVYEGEPYYTRLEQDALDRLVRTFVIDRLLSRDPGPEVRWIGDKTPRYATYLPHLMRIFPDARFINIVRDPRDVALSRLHQAKRAGREGLTIAGTAERSAFIRDGGLDWVRNVEPIAPFAIAHPGRLHSIRYEDMIADPAREAGRLFAFLGASTDRNLIDDAVAKTSFEALSGRKPGEEHPTSFLRKGIAGDWVGGLEHSAIAVLEQVAGPLMRTLGYV